MIGTIIIPIAQKRKMGHRRDLPKAMELEKSQTNPGSVVYNHARHRCPGTKNPANICLWTYLLMSMDQAFCTFWMQ